MKKTLLFTITNDPDYDQRMQRICTTLSLAGHRVILVGRAMQDAADHQPSYIVLRTSCFWKKGALQYIEYSMRLFFLLLFKKADAFCAIDIDTALPVYLASRIKKIPRLLDAHEYFSELKEVVTRPRIYAIWKRVEAFAIPRFPVGYTVGTALAAIFKEKFGVHYQVIRNLPYRRTLRIPIAERKPAIIYQGAVNEARGLEYLVPAMQYVDAELHIYGKGNFFEQSLELARQHNLEHKIKFMGMVAPAMLSAITPHYRIGINLVENNGMNQYLSLANKFFDYIQAGIPQVTMDFPEYAAVNVKLPVAVLLSRLETGVIADAINLLLNDAVLYEQLTSNCGIAAEQYCWENESSRLLDIYEKL